MKERIREVAESSSERRTKRSRKAVAAAMGKKALKGAAAMGVGGVFMLGLNNAYGYHTEIGPVRVIAHAKVGSSVGLTSDVADLELRRDNAPPVGFYIDVQGSDTDTATPEELVNKLEAVGDPAAAAETLADGYLRQAEFIGGFGALAGIVALSFQEWKNQGEKYKNKRRHQIVAGIGTTVVVGLGFGAAYVPTIPYNKVGWHYRTLNLAGQSYDIGYGGGGAAAVVNVIKTNENYYNDIKDDTKNALIPVKEEDVQERPDLIPVVVYSDWHCNGGMARVIKQATESLNITTAINLGDNELGATPEESICLGIIASNLKGLNNVIAPGNHDPTVGIKQLEDQYGFKVLDANNTTIKIHGVNVFGDGDPTVSPAFNDDLTLRNEKHSVEQFQTDVENELCKVRPGLTLIHEPQQITEKMRECSTVLVDGHTHNDVQPQRLNPNLVALNDGSAGGAAPTDKGRLMHSADGSAPNLGSVFGLLGQDATMSVLYFNSKTGAVDGERMIVINPDKKVTVSEYVDFSTLKMSTDKRSLNRLHISGVGGRP